MKKTENPDAQSASTEMTTLKKNRYVRDSKTTRVPRSKLKRLPKKIIEVEKKPTLVRLTELKFHPLLKRVGLLPELIGREEKLGKGKGKNRNQHKATAEEMQHDFEALVRSIAINGIREPIKVLKTEKGFLVVDGRHRVEAIKRVISNFANLGHSDEQKRRIAEEFSSNGISCHEVQEADVVSIIMDGVNRRHLSKGARAYLAVLMFPEVVKGAEARQKSGQPSAQNAEGLARDTGVSPRLIEEAVALFKQFEERADIRKKFEPAIWAGAGLAKLRCGIKGYLEKGVEPDEEPETEEQARLRITQERVDTAMQKWVGVATAFKFWDTIPEGSREPVIESGVKAVLALPAEVQDAIAEALSSRVTPEIQDAIAGI